MGKTVCRSASVLRLLILQVGVVVVLANWFGVTEADQTPNEKAQAAPDPLVQAWTKARCDGKYAMLLRQFKVAEDEEQYGPFREMGLVRVRQYRGHNDLPAGYWVYVAPYWYIWRDLTAIPTVKRAWGPEQATGKPDTTASGDFGTAWASLTPDTRDEWLMLEYDQPVMPQSIKVYETWNPGAILKVTAYRLDGREVEVWYGEDPTSTSKDMGMSELKLKADFPTNRIMLHLDSREVRGWNEIDAVALVDRSGKEQWATSAEASSTSADGNQQTLLQALIVTEQRVRGLEAELRQLRAVVEELRKENKE
ncbi:MAG: hypothetical protein ACK4RK_04360 [Gemmataceae bacterium]